VLVSFFEIYGGRCQDLLNDRERLLIREDGKGDVVIGGLQELEAQTEDDLLGFIEEVRLVCVGALMADTCGACCGAAAGVRSGLVGGWV
jgi:hypothetical protein